MGCRDDAAPPRLTTPSRPTLERDLRPPIATPWWEDVTGVLLHTVAGDLEGGATGCPSMPATISSRTAVSTGWWKMASTSWFADVRWSSRMPAGSPGSIGGGKGLRRDSATARTALPWTPSRRNASLNARRYRPSPARPPSKGAPRRRRVEYPRPREGRTRLHRRQPLAKPGGVHRGSQRDHCLPSPKVESRTRLPLNQGAMGIPR